MSPFGLAGCASVPPWEAGVDGATPGIIMWADPAAHIGEEYRQEFSRGVAEDLGKVVAVDQTVDVPYGSLAGCVKTEDRSSLETGVLENKYYCPGVGISLELGAAGLERPQRAGGGGDAVAPCAPFGRAITLTMPRPLSLAGAIVSVACAGAIATPGSFRTPIPTSSGKGPTVTPQASGTTSRLVAVSAVSERLVWASGAGGTFVVTTDGGHSWRAGVVAGAELLQFRDVEGVSEKVAYLLSIGPGEDSRIYRTGDGGKSWALQFQNHDPAAFYDCFDFWAPDRAIAFSDAVAGRFPAIRTNDGKTWQDIGDRLPAAQTGEGSFAASGTCVATFGAGNAWIGTGAAGKARVLATADGGNTWTAHETPILQGSPTSGVASLAFRDRSHGMLGGGDVADTATAQHNVARSADGGRTWSLATPTPFPGAVYGLSYVPGPGRLTVVATGPGGAAWSPDEGTTWSVLPGVSNFWGVAFASSKAGWLVGAGGTIVKLGFGDH